MTTNDRFELAMTDWLHEDAAGRVSDHLAEVLEVSATTRQRAAWSSPERWLPVDTAFRPRLFHAPRANQLVLVAALILAVLAALLLYAGSRQQHLPPPFGPARNGIILTSGDGNIGVVDPVTLARRIIVPDGIGPATSRDGTRFLFIRGGPSPCGKPDCGAQLMVANIDGSGVRQLTPAWPSLDWADWSPDGSKIAFLTANQHGPGRVLAVVNADGSDLRVDIVGRDVYPTGWLPPNGNEIVYRTETDPVGIYAIKPDGTGVRTLTTRPAASDGDYGAPAISPDGRRLAYTDDHLPAHEHILDLGSGVDSQLPGTHAQFDGIFSPDGKLIAYVRAVDGDRFQLVVAPVDGSDEGKPIGPAVPAGYSDNGPSINNVTWSADGTAVLANYSLGRVARLIPIDGSPSIDLDHGEVALPNMQRLAP